MLKNTDRLAIFMEDNLKSDYGKMGFGIMRYSENPIACVIDSQNAGRTVHDVNGLPFDIPIVRDIAAAIKMQAKVLVLGIAPSGGKFPKDWEAPVVEGLRQGMHLVNGLHDDLNAKFGNLLQGSNQWIWDIRKPAFIPNIGTAKAAELDNTRILLVGTDMAVGKMTTGLELYRWIKAQGVNTSFVATGQIGISITGDGIPLDAFKVDHAAGAVETMVLKEKNSQVIFIEGQGSLLNPGSTATLPLMRGSCPTHLILCHRADLTSLRKVSTIKIPDLSSFIELNESMASVCGAFPRPITLGIALNTSRLAPNLVSGYIEMLKEKTGLLVTDVVRNGPQELGEKIIGLI